MIFTLGIAARFSWFFFSSYILSRWTWALVSIVSSLVFTSGFMFTRIRNVPFAQNTREGPQWIAAGYQSQFGAETWVVATLCEFSDCLAILADSQHLIIIIDHYIRWNLGAFTNCSDYSRSTHSQTTTTTCGHIHLDSCHRNTVQCPYVAFQA